MTKTIKRQDAANTFLAVKAEIDELLARLTESSETHFDVTPENVRWGQVGNLGYVRDRLREATNFLYHEGEDD